VFLGFASPPFVPAWPVAVAFVAAPEPALLGVVRLSATLGVASTLLVALSESGRNTLSFLPKQPMSQSVQSHECLAVFIVCAAERRTPKRMCLH
jgi:hypothetical protein